MIPSWLKTLHSLHRGLSRHLYRLPPPAFRTGYGESYGYTYVQSTSFSTYVGNFTSNILRSNSVKRHSTHFLHQDHPDGASRFSENKNEGDEKKSGDKKNRSDGGGGCGGGSCSGGGSWWRIFSSSEIGQSNDGGSSCGG